MDKQNENLVGNYKIREKIGQGAFSEVYLAQHIVFTDDIVAIKILAPVFAEVQREQFIREAQVLKRLKHPHILPVLDVGFHNNRAYLVMEYASGGSLQKYMERHGQKPLPTELAVKIILQISQALEYAHLQNIIHRDVKPGNILFNSSGDVLLADFGTAILLDPGRSEITLDMVGTPVYMAPERLTGAVSKASDQYALGCIAYELLTGQKPFIADNVWKVFQKQKQEMPTPLRQLVRELAQQVIPLIRAAFARKDWSDVLQKTSALLNPEAAHTLTPELYHLHGLALFEVGEVEKAQAALKTALELESNEETRAIILQDYTNMQQAHSLISVPQGVEVFFSYSHKDKALRDELEKYLSNLKRQHAIVAWHDDEIDAGAEWDNEIKEHIDRAHLILLLVSQDFLASDYCYEEEMKRALKRHEAGAARVIPIILRPTHLEVTPFRKLQALPAEAKPVTLWSNRDEAFLDIAKGIQKVVDKLTKPRI